MVKAKSQQFRAVVVLVQGNWSALASVQSVEVARHRAVQGDPYHDHP
jgi:hypothetical protein